MAARLTDVHGTPGTAHDVLRNVDAMESAIASLGKASWTHHDIHAVHATLLPRESRGTYRTEQVCIGGRTPLTASYVAPPQEEVPDLVADLLHHVTTTGDPPLVVALLVHAQFETIHPYEDGNGRTGRALFHALLARSGIVDHGVLPLSLVLRDDVVTYVAALTAYRPGTDELPAVADARATYLTVMLDVVIQAARIAGDVIDEVAAVHARWQPYAERLRVDSSVHRVLDLLVEQPVVTPGLVQQRLGVTRATAGSALTELQRVGVVQLAGGRFRRQNVYQAGEVLALMDSSVPGPPTISLPPLPPVPVRRYGGERCGHQLPRKAVPCTLPVGHPGRHRTL